MSSELIKKTADYVRLKQIGEHTGHDWYHTERVWKNALFLAQKEGGDLELIELLALLHDIGDTRNYEFEKHKGPLVLRGMMDVLDIASARQNQLIKLIEEIQYKGNETIKPSTIEGKIVQDADYLDLLGAVGIARVFATGGSIRRMLYNPNQKPRHKLTREDYIYHKQDGNSFNYFQEKVLKIPTMLNTKTAKELAAPRVEFVKNFIKEFEAQWNFDGKLIK